MQKLDFKLKHSKLNFTFSLMVFLLFCSSFSGIAQVTISGKITSADNQEALIGVSVSVKNTNIGTSTDENGMYRLQVSQDANTLVFSYVGYASKEIKIDGQTRINVALDAGISVDEVLVTALGVKQESRALGYAAQKLDNKDIAEVQSPNFVDNLAGKIAGVTVTSGATGPGSTSKITIRGEASFSNNNPLFIVDGTPINNNSIVNVTSEAPAGFQEVDFGNGAMELDASNIATLSVLKGPSATALYGTRAANGVIIITTKDGSENKGTSIDISSSVFVDRAFQLPRFQNSYGQGNSGQFEYVDGLGGGINDNITYSYGPAFSDNLNIAQFDSPVTLPDGRVVRGGDVTVHGGAPITPSLFRGYANNLKNFYETGVTLINNVAVSSGTENGS